ncbi:AAA family ATPase [Rhizobium sp. NRK18]|uniref:AAA family ATPase n=1 Tax=Rhizobium sp. NRK18 TaxID=2964667 RepID=UPI0021C37A92|nr:AAA family ATPase [Rhizobium sp. NRK18]MCQ2002868.1 AAA family ATPase [Rhizobium sp. NRK18]
MDLPDILPKGWDLADDVPEGVDIEALLRDAKPSEENLTNFLISAKKLAVLDIPPREMIVDPLIATNSVNMMFAERGTGKTWVALAMAKAVATGEDFLAYHVPEPRPVLLIDGEMPLADLTERIQAMRADDIDNLQILSSEVMHHEFHALNIGREDDQHLITSMLDQLADEGRKPSLIILDNLSSLRRGVEENDNSALDGLLQWLIALRHKGYATLVVHHAGKLGNQRGASRLEDPLDTTIKLTLADAPKGDGAAVNMEFTKTRNVKPNPAYLTMELVEGDDGILDWDYGETTKVVPQDHTLRIIYGGPAGDGSKRFAKQKELVDAVGLKPPAISKHLSALRHDELVDKKGLTVTEKGKERLRDVFPKETFD